MKLNYDCIRDVLLYLEKNLTVEDHVFQVITLTTLKNVLDYSEEDVFYSVYNLYEVKFIEGRIKPVGNNKLEICDIENITYAGHKFLESIKPETIWNKTKSVLSKVGVHTLGFIESTAKEIAVETAKQAITVSMSQK